MKTLFGLTLSELDVIKSVLNRYPQIIEVKIFGSRALGNFKPASDVDLALYGNIDIKTLQKIKADLEEYGTLPYLFDLVIYQDLTNNNLKNHIDQFGKILQPGTP